MKDSRSMWLLLLLLLSILLLLCSFNANSQTLTTTPKIGLVLSGGGAKGAAHVGALKVIEEVGVPIDYIAGTSIGAIIGGLYAIGYTPNQLDSIVRQNDWMALITDKVSRNEIPFPFKEDDERFIITLSLERKSSSKDGLLEGKSISALLDELTNGINDSISFDSLPIPFACVATDMVRNKKEVIRSGNLVEAMRASMGIPLAFTPVRKDGKVLIDGGFKDNLAIEVVKDMGADYIIAIDAQSELANEEHLQSIPDMLNQLMLMICQSELDEKLKDVDVYIKVDVNGYTAASFGKEDLNILIDRGEEAAKEEIEAFRTIKGQVNSNPYNGDLKPKRNLNKEYTILTFRPIEKKLKIGLRLDSEYIAAILFNANLQNNKGTGFDFTLRAGKQSYIKANYILQTSPNQSFSINNKIAYNDIFLYNKGDKQYNPTYLNEAFGLNYNRYIKNKFQLQVGANIDYHRLISSLPYEKQILDKHSVYIRNYNQMEYESLNNLYYPTNGIKIKAGYNFYKSLNSNPSFYTLNFQFQKVFSITEETTVIPILSSRYVSKKNIPFFYANAMGGIMPERYFNHQLSFVGINHVEVAKNFLGIAQINVNQRIIEKHYLRFIGNFGVNSDKISRKIQDTKLYGVGIGYSYNSPIGPVEMFFNYSNRTTCLGWLLNVGYSF